MKRRSKQVPTRCLALLVPLVLLDRGAASAAEPEGSRAGREAVSVTTSLVTPFFGAYYLETKVRASNAFGVLLNTSYLSLENGDWKSKAGTVGAGVDYYFQGDALRRWYVEAIGELWFSSWRHEPSGEVAPIVLGYAGLALVGYQFVFDLGPVLDLGAGVVAFHSPSAHVELAGASVSSEAFTRLYPAVKLNVGWAF
jgi:hypothetical protein